MNLPEIKTSIKTNYLMIFSGIVILIILLLSINGFYWADDYGFMSDLKRDGVFKNCYEGYFRWDGRFLSLGAIFQCFSLLYLQIETIILIWTCCVLLSGVLMFYIIDCELNINFKNKHFRVLMLLIFPIILWLGSLIHASETIYWATGGTYSFDLMLGAIWVLLFLKLQKNKNNLFLKILFLLFSFAVGGLTQNLSMPLITLISIQLMCNFLDHKKSKIIFNFLILLFVISGLIFIMIAPGNWLRIKDEKTVVDNFNVLILLKNYFYVLLKFFTRSIFAIVASGILAFSVALFINPKLNLPKISFIKMPKSRKNWSVILSDFKWLLVASSSALPFIAIPMFSGRRTVIYFGYFIMIFAFVHISKLFKKSQEVSSSKYINQNIKISKFGIILILMISFSIAIHNLIYGATLKKAIANRENILKNSQNKTIHLKEIGPELSTICFQFADYPYTGAYVKSSQERYFGVKIILDK
jgi:Family of unknown function (DUF6056)